MKTKHLFSGLTSVALATAFAAQTYTYDPAGRLTSAGYPDGRVIRYQYDNNGNITGLNTFLDSDLDGMEDNWEILHFGSIVLGDPNADGDKDGLTELAEFAMGRNPDLKDANEATIVSVGSDDGEQFLEFTYTRSKIGFLFDTYTIEFARDLDNWFSGPAHAQQVGLPTDLGGEIERVRFRVTHPVTTGSKLFVRLNIERRD